MATEPDEMILPFFSMFKKFKKKISEKYPDLHLNISQVEALHFIKDNKKASMNDLSLFLDITPPSVTVLIDKLAEAGLIKRDGNKGDRRVVVMSFTKKGLEMFKAAQKEKTKIAREMLYKLNGKEREQLLLLLKKLVNEK